MSMKDEAQARCQDYDVPLVWTQDVPDLTLTRNGYYHLERILREALSNALRAGSNSIEVSASVKGPALVVTMINYCKSSDSPDLPRIDQGLGREIMRARAQALGAEISVKPHDEQGTVCWQLILEVPLDGPLLDTVGLDAAISQSRE